MRGALIPVFVAGITPILVLTLVWLAITPGLVSGLVEWQAPILWTRQIEGPVENGNVDSMAADASNVYAAGDVWLGNNKPGGPSYYFVDKYDRNGNQIWNRHFGAPGATDFGPGGGAAIDDFVASAAVDGGAIYVALSFNRTSLLHKYDTDGNFQWARIFGNLSSLSYDLSHVVNVHRYVASVATAGNRIFAVGTAIVNDALVGEVAGYASDGKLLWASNLGADEPYGASPYPLAIYSDAQAEYIAVNLNNGSYLRKLDPNGMIQWSHHSDYRLDALSGDASGIYVAAYSGFGLVLSKLDLNGVVLWSFETDAPDGRASVGHTHLSVSSSGMYVTESGFVVKYDADGNRVWYVPSLSRADVSYAISASSDGVYFGAGLPPADSPISQGRVSLLLVSGSKSLIMFGIGPPYSFAIVAVLSAIIVGSMLWVRRRWEQNKRSHPATADEMRYSRRRDPKTEENKFVSS